MYQVYDASSSGPVSSMPGSHHSVPADAACVRHPTVKAVRRVQGETDSMGCEYTDMCALCVAAYDKAAKVATSGNCDWCKSFTDSLRPRRDYDEGSSGRVYQVCQPCVTKDNEAWAAEVEDHGDYNPWDNYLD